MKIVRFADTGTWAARTFSRQLLQHLAAEGFYVLQSPFPILIYGIDEDAFFIIVLAGLYPQLCA